MFEENNEDYILNLNDIIKLGRKKYVVIKKHIQIENKNSEIKDKKVYNISDLNNLSKPIFDLNIKEEQYKINKKYQNFQNKIENNININSKLNNNNIKKDEKIQDSNYNNNSTYQLK